MSEQKWSTSSCDKKPTSCLAEKRIQRDIDEINANDNNSSIIFVDPIDDNFLHLEAAIIGPDSTPYANGIFLLNLIFSDQYPVS